MSGYCASARIVSAPPRLARGQELRANRLAVVSEEARRPIASPAMLIEPVPRTTRPGPIEERLHVEERLHAARERWSQLTFFLFDPDSWRT
ncbi:MAG TPA: hypothetical protein VM427_01850 [Patescibacteria group bacterium]|nr:hypothetical protein [Patescibacteria group bacterium]